MGCKNSGFGGSLWRLLFISVKQPNRRKQDGRSVNGCVRFIDCACVCNCVSIARSRECPSYPIQCPLVYLLHDLWEQRRHTLIDERENVSIRLRVAEIQSELLLHLEQILVHIRGQVGNVGVAHETQQVENEVGVLTEDVEAETAAATEVFILTTVGAAHGLHHLLAELHRRREGLRIATKDEGKILTRQKGNKREK